MPNRTVLVSLIALLAYTAASYVIGRLIVSWVTRRPTGIMRASAVLLGSVVLGLQLWAYGLAHLPWNNLTLFLPWAVVVAFRWRHLTQALADDWHLLVTATRRQQPWEPLEIVLAVGAILIALVYLLNLVSVPVFGWDAIAMWLYKAKLYFTLHAVDLRPIAQDVHRNLDYPPLFSLMVSSLFVLAGHIDDIFGKSINLVFFVAGAATLLVSAWGLLGRRMALVVTFVFVAMPIFAGAIFNGPYMGWADYPLGILMMVALLHLLEARRTGRPASYALALVFGGMAAVTKNEGISFLAILVGIVAYFAVRDRRLFKTQPHGDLRRALAAMALGVTPFIVWQVTIRLQGIEPAVINHRDWTALVGSLPGRTSVIFGWLRHLLAVHLDYPWMVLTGVLASILVFLRRPAGALTVWSAFALQLLAYLIAYLATPYDLVYILSTTFDRLMIQVAPPLLVVFVAALSPPMPLARPVVTAPSTAVDAQPMRQ